MEERHNNGALKSTVRLNGAGKRFGDYVEYFDSGTIKIRGGFRVDLKEGRWEHFDESAKRIGERTWKDGVLQRLRRWDAKGVLMHEVVRQRGRLFFVDPESKRLVDAWPRSTDEIATKIAALDPPKERFRGEIYSRKPGTNSRFDPGILAHGYLTDAARHAGVYRYLSGLDPHLEIGATHTEESQHAAMILKILGRLTHEPDRPPDVPDEVFKKARKGAAESNLHHRVKDLRVSIDGYMDDSDPTNIDRVGHRRWILNWSLLKVGFGFNDGWTAMNVFDQSRSGKAPPFTAYPGPGFFPSRYIAGKHVAWSFSWNEDRGRLNTDPAPAAELWSLDEDYDLSLQIPIKFSALSQTFSAMPALIFLPDWPAAMPLVGSRILVKVRGAVLPKTAPPALYVVEIFALEPTDESK